MGNCLGEHPPYAHNPSANQGDSHRQKHNGN